MHLNMVSKNYEHNRARTVAGIFVKINVISIPRCNRYAPTTISNKNIKIINGNIARVSRHLREMKLAHLNTRGGIKGNKFDELGGVLDDHKPDILGLSEINYDARDNVPINLLNYNFIPGFTYSDQKTRLGVLVKRGITVKVRNDIMKRLLLPCVWLEVNNGGDKIAIINCYREFRKYKTDDSTESFSMAEQVNRFRQFLNEWMNQSNKYDEMFVLGDLNIDVGHDKYKDRVFKNMLSGTVSLKGYEQLVRENTWSNTKGAVSVIDHIYTNSTRYRNVHVDHCFTSGDHALISVVRDCRGKFQKPQFKRVRVMKDYTKSELLFVLLGMDLERIKAVHDPSVQVSMLAAALNVAVDVVCPAKIIADKKQHTHWMTDELRLLLKQRDFMYKENLKYINSPDPDLVDYAVKCARSYRELRNKVNREIPKAKRDYHAVRADQISNAKQSWSIMNEMTGRNPRYHDPVIIHHEGEEISDTDRLVGLFNDFYQTKVQTIKDSIPPTPPEPEVDVGMRDVFGFQPVSYLEVAEEINKLTRSGAEGIDNISNRIVRDARWVLAPILTNIVNNCLDQGIFPDMWKTGKINITYKKGPRTELSNYRPVTVLCSLSKVLEKVMFRQITRYLQAFGLFDPAQYGFRAGHSTTHAILDYIHSVLKAREDPENKVNTIFLDLSAAFDIVEHETALKKLEKLGFDQNALKLLRSYLCGRSVFTEIGLSKSKLITVHHGVPQGSILGPLLYLIYILNIKNIDGNKKIIYADDTTAITVAKTYPELKAKTDQAMERMVRYFSGSGLKLNASKTELVSHGLRETEVDLGSSVLPSRSPVKLLGVLIDSSLNFHDHINGIIKKIKSRLVMFRKISRTAGLRARLMFGHGILLSVIQYCVPAWGGTDEVSLNKLRVWYDRCVREMAGREYRDMSMEAIRSELKIMSFKQMRDFFDLTVFNKILHTGEPANLASQIQTEFVRETRGAAEGQVRIVGIPRTERMKKSFLYRSAAAYNRLPRDLRKLGDDKRFNKFKDCVKKWLLGIPYDTGWGHQPALAPQQ